MYVCIYIYARACIHVLLLTKQFCTTLYEAPTRKLVAAGLGCRPDQGAKVPKSPAVAPTRRLVASRNSSDPGGLGGLEAIGGLDRALTHSTLREVGGY